MLLRAFAPLGLLLHFCTPGESTASRKHIHNGFRRSPGPDDSKSKGCLHVYLCFVCARMGFAHDCLMSCVLPLFPCLRVSWPKATLVWQLILKASPNQNKKGRGTCCCLFGQFALNNPMLPWSPDCREAMGGTVHRRHLCRRQIFEHAGPVPPPRSKENPVPQSFRLS